MYVEFNIILVTMINDLLGYNIEFKSHIYLELNHIYYSEIL